jgi:hypothetical protein
MSGVKKPWWEDKSERNNVTRGGIGAVEALRIEIKRLRAVNKELMRKADKAEGELVDARIEMNTLFHENRTLKKLETELGYCNPDIQVARMAREEAEKTWMEQWESRLVKWSEQQDAKKWETNESKQGEAK